MIIFAILFIHLFLNGVIYSNTDNLLLTSTQNNLLRPVSARNTQICTDGIHCGPKELPYMLIIHPYSAMIFDIDNTLTGKRSEIEVDTFKLLLDFMEKGVQIALISTQCLAEINEFILKVMENNPEIPPEQKPLLKNLTLYPAAGAQCYRFDNNGNLIEKPVYDRTSDNPIFKKIGITRIKKDPIKGKRAKTDVEETIIKVTGKKVTIHPRGGLITVSGIPKGVRDAKMDEVEKIFKRKGWPLKVRRAGRGTFHILIKGVDKGNATQHFITNIVEGHFDRNLKPNEILIVGDSFRNNGLDLDMAKALIGARVVSVGRRGPKLKDLKKISPAQIELYRSKRDEYGRPATTELLDGILNQTKVFTAFKSCA